MLFKEFVERIVFETLLEIRTGFKWNEFKKIDEQLARSRYANKHLKFLGSGSSREVYLLSSRYVLKLARWNDLDKGIAQNEAEIEIYTNPKTKPIIAKVYDTADNYNWIVSELVRPLKNEDEFEALTGIEFDDFVNLIRIMEDYLSFEAAIKFLKKENEEMSSDIENLKLRNPELHNLRVKRYTDIIERNKRLVEIMKTKPLIEAVSALMDEENLLAGDIERIDHWGKTVDGRVALLDYGYTESVRAKLY